MPLGPDQLNQEMVDRLIAEGALWSRPLIAAFRATPRHRFVDRVFQYQRKHNRWREILTREAGPEELRLVYADRALITHLRPNGAAGSLAPTSSSSQPSLMAQMLADLTLARGLRVLEIGAGTGYNAALLAHVVGPELVTSIDVDRDVLSEAWAHLRGFPDRGVTLHHADGRHGYADEAPFDRIMVTAATPDLEPAWLEQLAYDGLLLAPLALAPGLAYVVWGTVRNQVFEGKLTRAAYFMPLRAEGEAGSSDQEAPPLAADVRTVPAPWPGWFDRKRLRANWLGFIQALAFFGLLRGLQVHYRTLANGELAYGVERDGDFCWLGAQTWQVNGPSGHELGWDLWRAFLDAGGPRPTEFSLQAMPGLKPGPERGAAYFRQGPCCGQRWTPLESFPRPFWI
jgi:protein-L-isoaspartate(D-aspartate) O-methyltransferase